MLLVFVAQGLPCDSVSAQINAEEHLAVILILDDSGSMETSDPTDLRYTAAQLFVSLLDEGDAVGALRFSTTTTSITNNIEIITSLDIRTRLVENLSPVTPAGYTDVKAAFEEAYRMKTAFTQDNFKVAIIFLTDGHPEISNSYTSYEQEALNAAKNLGNPILSVALTTGGQSTFLNQVANESDGQVIFANSAADLLDIYLQILGNLKDRTVIGTGSVSAPDKVSLPLDPSLMPYVDRVSFVVSKPATASARLIAPGGQTIPSDDPSIEFSIQDQRFVVNTLQQPASGDWNIELTGTGEAQVRAILYSRLRVRLVSPAGSFETGQPLPIVVKLVEEQPGQVPVTIIGEASFSALITLPNGSQDSLDQFYDDGTHGDVTAGDGLFTRLYVNTNQSGTYQVKIQGYKGAIPVVYQTQIQGIDFPMPILDQPTLKYYDIRTNAIPLQIHLSDTVVNELDRGSMIAAITKPDGNFETVVLENTGNSYTGAFLPAQDGLYTIRFEPKDATYQGLPYLHFLEMTVEIRIVPTILVENVQIGLTPPASGKNPRFELLQAQQGIPLLITLSSNSNRAEMITTQLSDLPGFTLLENSEQSVTANGRTSMILHLLADPALLPQTHQGSLVLHTSDGVDLVGGDISLVLDLFEPTIRLKSVVPSTVSTGTCLDPMLVRLVLNLESNSIQNEEVQLHLEDLSGASLNLEKITVPPGSSQVELIITPGENTLKPGDYAARLVMDAARPGLKVIGDSSIKFQVTTVWVNCRKPMIISGLSLIFGIIILIMIIKRMTPPKLIVKGTFIYWNKETPGQTNPVYLTQYNKPEIKIGKGSQNDVIIPDASLEDEHILILAKRDENNAMSLTLHPLASISRGYRKYTEDITLEDAIEYTMGNIIFKFIFEA